MKNTILALMFAGFGCCVIALTLGFNKVSGDNSNYDTYGYAAMCPTTPQSSSRPSRYCVEEKMTTEEHVAFRQRALEHSKKLAATTREKENVPNDYFSRRRARLPQLRQELARLKHNKRALEQTNPEISRDPNTQMLIDMEIADVEREIKECESNTLHMMQDSVE